MSKRTSNIEPPSDDLMSVKDFAATFITRRGNPATVQYIYNQIYRHKGKSKKYKDRKKPSFEYVETDTQVWIKK